MKKTAIMHHTGREYVIPVSRDRLSIRIRVEVRQAERCRLVYWNRYSEDRRYAVQMECVSRDGAWDTYEAVVGSNEPVRYIRYYFEIVAGGERIDVDEYVVAGAPFAGRYFEYFYTNPGDVLSLPQWAKGATYYQIFPDRFRNGDTGNDPADVQPWGSMPDREHFTGGDLRGIIERVEYLAELGADIVYLTPVFHARSNHRYDTTDYMKVDPRLGTLTDLKELVAKLHGKGIRVLLDGVFNHCGVDFGPFKDVVENGEGSKYRDWFFVDDWPADLNRENYETVGYYKWMPKINLSNPDAKAYMLDAAAYWIREAGIDGWRIDVADEVDYLFLSSLRERVKAENPDAILLGECWKDAGRLLQGGRLDSVMNYRFRDTAVDFFVKGIIDAGILDRTLNHLYTVYPGEVAQGLYNLLDSHDTERFLTLCGGDVKKYKLAVAFQMTMPGAPAVYYGDEIGLTGGNDPDCRKCMEWDAAKWDREINEWYRTLIALRRENEALRYGDWASNLCAPGVYGYVREYGDKRAYVVLNASDKERTVVVPLYEKAKSIFAEVLPGDGTYKSVAVKKRKQYHNGDMHDYHSKLSVKLNGYEIKVLNPGGR
jgi:cyclomaltodextrinase